MADQLLSVVNTLLGHVTSQALAAYARIHGLSDQLTRWHKNLVVFRYVMVSAEERQMRGDARVNLWLDDLREVAYDMEDLLDLFSIEAQGKVLNDATRRRSSKLTSFLFPCCSKMDPRALLSDHRLAKQIEEVDLRLEEVIHQKALLGFAENYVAQPPTNPYRPCPHSTSLPVHRFVGREEQMERLLARLTRSDLAEGPDQPFTVVSIVGMGGLGKTALAKQLYNHEAAGSEVFPVKAWTSVSDAFDIVTVTSNILLSVDPHIDIKQMPLDWLQNMLKHRLVGKKFLVVLDDVWSEIQDELWSLLDPFRCGANGSRILLTTRSRRVAEFVGDQTPLALDLLSMDESLSLLAYRAIGEESFENRPHLQDIAVRLAKKCGGLPLAVTVIGGILSVESNDKKWKKVLEHNLWKIQDKNNRIPVVLQLSYIHLPIYLKQCFAACAIFPKGYHFGKDQLIDLWFGHGLLQKGIGETYYDTGIDYLHELEVRSLLQKVNDDGSLYYMHGLVNDLARSVVGIKCYYKDEYEGPSNYQEKVRRATFFTGSRKYLDAIEVDAYCSMKKLRAFISLNRCSNNYHNDVFVSEKVINDLIMGCEYLRMLSLRGFHIKKLPDHIGDLKLLRFIDLSFTEVEVLPESICGLINLESLILQSCIQFKALPRSIHKLSKLIHLDITGSNLIEEMPQRIGSLTSLEILPRFVVGKGIGQGLKELGPLKDLVGKLHIANPKEVKDVGDAEDANLHEKKGIRDLSYDWGAGDNEGTLHEEQDELNILDHLKPSRKIERLEILNYGGRTFPSWFGHPYLDNVTDMTLRNCRSVESLPSLGKLPSLKRLEISHLDALSRIGDEFFGTEKPFPSLLGLTFRDRPAWEEWSSREDYPQNKKLFPRLQHLDMRDCPLLKRGLPRRLDGLSVLYISGCPLLETWGDSLSLPSLRWMHIHDSGLLNYLVDVTSLTQLSIKRVPQLVGLDRKFLSSCVSLKVILISECPRFKSFVDGDIGKEVLPKLEGIHISRCGALENLPDDFDCLPSLTHLAVDNCWKLSSLPSSGFPSTLRSMSLRGCPSRPLSQLLSMRLPRRASFLCLGGCEEFTWALPECWLPSELEVLDLINLEGLTSITDTIAGDNHSRSLHCLHIQQCQSLTTLPDCLQHLSSLSDLQVICCPALELDFFPNLPYSLSVFKLIDCPKVRTLPRDMGKLTSLKCLTVSGCRAITGFPRGGLPPNLEHLTLQHCENLNQPLEDWGLKELRALQELRIEGIMDEVVCFPSSVSGSGAWCRVLPSSLITLDISEMKELERLAGGLPNHLTSLRMLIIAYCEKMRFLPEEGLPDSLEEFRIRSCPLLEERCSEERKGEYWPLLQLVPRVKILST